VSMDPSAESEQRSDELSQAARAVVRDPGDPRIDAHLAALGLADAGDRSAPGTRGRPDPTAAAEVAELRARISQLEGQLQAAAARARALGFALVAGATVIVILLLLLVVR
jgi:hypothetical protein